MAATDLTLEFDLQGVSRGKDHLQRQWADFADSCDRTEVHGTVSDWCLLSTTDIRW